MQDNRILCFLNASVGVSQLTAVHKWGHSLKIQADPLISSAFCAVGFNLRTYLLSKVHNRQIFIKFYLGRVGTSFSVLIAL